MEEEKITDKVLLKVFKWLSTPDVKIKDHLLRLRKLQDLSGSIGKKEQVHITETTIKRGNHEIPLKIYSPEEKKTYPLIIFYHGGGFATGSLKSYERICRMLSKQLEVMLIAIDYRLAPEFKFPTGLKDCYFATKHIYYLLNELGLTEDDVTLMGDSAGGNFSAVISILAAKTKEFTVKRQILFYPLLDTDHSETSTYDSVHQNGSNYVLTNQRIDEYLELYIQSKKELNSYLIAPIKSKRLKNQPKTLIITADLDPLRDEGKAYAELLKSYKNDVTYINLKKHIHGFLSNMDKVTKDIVLKEMKEFLKDDVNE